MRFGLGRMVAAAVLGILSATGTAHAEGIGLDAEKIKLANGMELLLHEDHASPLVTVNVWYHVGSKDEPTGKNGFAHLFEHVMFQGSKHVPEDTYFKFLERAGATSINGSTNRDRTNYYQTVPKNRLELALWLESDRMGFLLDHVDQATFESQREVVKNERRQSYENAPYGNVEFYLADKFYPEGHPYRLLTIGTPHDLDAASLDDVKKFFRDWYRPNNATLAIAGDIDKKKTKELVEKYFGPIPSAPIPVRNKVPEVKLDKEARVLVDAGVELSRVVIHWPTPAFFAKGDGELDLFAHALAGGKTSRLYKKLVDELQLAQSVVAYQASEQLGSSFTIIATGQKGKAASELLTAIDAELAALRCVATRCEKLTAEELGRAKTMTLAENIFHNEEIGARADRMNSFNQVVGKPNYFKEDLARYENASLADVEKAFQTYIDPTKRVIALVTPVKGAPVAGTLHVTTKEEGAK